MSKTKISQYSTTNALNTDIGGIDIDENCLPSNLNDAIREVMVQLKQFQDGSSGDSLTITGTATLNGTTIPASATLTKTTDKLSVFAATSSSELAGVISDETGSGSLVFGTSPTLSSPTITGTGTAAFGNLSYTGTLTGSTGVLNIGSGQIYKDASGNVGIGTSSPEINSGFTTQTIQGTKGGVLELFSSDSALFGRVYSDTSNTGVFLSNQKTGPLVFSTSGSERMRIDSSGNVGIGTSSPTVPLDIVGSFRYTSDIICVTSGNTARFGYGAYNAAAAFNLFVQQAVPLAFGTNATERARIDASGNLLVGTTSNLTNELVAVSFPGNVKNGMTIRNSAASGAPAMIRFEWGATTVGSINSTSTTTTYAISSDYRLKENVRPLSGALERVMQLKPSEWDWKADGSQGVGFIAHEVQAIRPQAVTGTKDAVDKDGKPQYQGMDASFLIADLTAAIQELKAEVDSLKAQLNSGA